MADTVYLHPLSVLEDGDEVVVGRRDVDAYAVFPPDGAALLARLQEGLSPPQAAAWYAQAYGERVDIDAFVGLLRELDFVRAEDDAPATGGSEPIGWQRLGRAVFATPAWVGYAALVIAAALACRHDPRLLPRADDVLFCGSLAVSGLVLAVGQALLALVHEGFHVLAGRRLGLRTSVGVSRRLYYVVYETRLDGLVSVPRRQRYLVILAGLVADVLVVSLLILLAAAAGERTVTGGLCLALAFTTLPRITWQFFFHLRTDIYVLITTVTGLDDLDAAARARLRGLLRRAPARDGRELAERDLRAARWYAPLIVLGHLFSVAMLVLVVVPLATRFLGPAVEWALAGRQLDSDTIGSAVLLAVTATELGLALAVGLRERRANATTEVTLA